MKPSDFLEANSKLKAPEGQEDTVSTLPVWRHPSNSYVISKWRMTFKERVTALCSGYIWLHVWAGTHPPVSLSTEEPFEPQQKTGWRLALSRVAVWVTLVVSILLGVLIFFTITLGLFWSFSQ
jgi:hypothetical protein